MHRVTTDGPADDEGTIRHIVRTKASVDTTDSFEGEDASGSFQAPLSALITAALAGDTDTDVDPPSLPAGHDAQTAVAGAATSAQPNVAVTSEALAGATTYTLTLTDAVIFITSIIQCTAWDGATTGVQIVSITVSAGSVVIVFAMAALTGTLKANISISN